MNVVAYLVVGITDATDIERTEKGRELHLEGSIVGFRPTQFVEVTVTFHQVECLTLLCDVEKKMRQRHLGTVVIEETVGDELYVGIIVDAVVDGYEAVPRILLLDCSAGVEVRQKGIDIGWNIV